MAVEIIDFIQLAYEQKRRKVVFNTPRLHAWVHYYPNPGERDDMHCHNADQTFYVIEGECTMHFPDGGKGGNETWDGCNHHRRIFLPAGKQRRWPNDHDGQSIGAFRSHPAHKL